jgi:hypothetical protein
VGDRLETAPEELSNENALWNLDRIWVPGNALLFDAVLAMGDGPIGGPDNQPW